MLLLIKNKGVCMNIQKASSNMGVSFKSVLRTEENQSTEKLYRFLKTDHYRATELLTKSKFGERDTNNSYLILVDDEEGQDATKYLALNKKYEASTRNLCSKSDKELERMLPQTKIDQFRRETSGDPHVPDRSSGTNYVSKMLTEIRGNLENELMDNTKALYNECLAKAKTISVSKIFHAIIRATKGH